MLINMLANQNMEYLLDSPTIATNNSQTAIDKFLTKRLGLEIISVECIITCLSDQDIMTVKRS